MSTKAAYVGSDEEWRAYWKLLQIDGIASPEFANRIDLARELGLLAPLLAGDQETLKRLAAECKERLSAQIHWVYPEAPNSRVIRARRRFINDASAGDDAPLFTDEYLRAGKPGWPSAANAITDQGEAEPLKHATGQPRRDVR